MIRLSNITDMNYSITEYVNGDSKFMREYCKRLLSRVEQMVLLIFIPGLYGSEWHKTDDR